MFYTLKLVYCSIYRLSYFDNPEIRLMQDNEKYLSIAYIHPHDDNRFFFKFTEIEQGLLKIQSVESELVLEFIKYGNKLQFKEDNDISLQYFSLRLSKEGGFRISQKSKCLILVKKKELKFQECSDSRNQLFMLIKKDNTTIIKPFGEVTYVYDTKEIIKD